MTNKFVQYHNPHITISLYNLKKIYLQTNFEVEHSLVGIRVSYFLINLRKEVDSS